MKNNIAKYLSNYAEEDISYLSDINGTWDQVAIIPVKNELEDLINLFSSSMIDASKSQKILVILVINGSTDSSEEVHKKNLDLIEHIEQKTGALLKDNRIALTHYNNFDLLVVNRATQNIFDKKSGVGLARKIGCDIALSLYDSGKLKSPWLRCTDADVTLPNNYFEINPSNKYSVIKYGFYHLTEDESTISQALMVYEIYLRYYYLGLKKANSRYAFYTIGSCMAIQAESYAVVRGFPKKREAAEDFYMMNKLAKVGKVFTPDSIIKIKCRESDRVPFGTGASTKKIKELIEKGEDYKIYAPIVFDYLEEFNNLIDSFCETKNQGLFQETKPLIKEFINQSSFLETITHSLNHSTQKEKLQEHIYNWFDAFRQLKFIHFISETHEPLVWNEALEKSHFVYNLSNLSLADIKKTLFENKKSPNVNS